MLQALDDLKKTRRRLHRFGWLVEQCNRFQLDGGENAFEAYKGGDGDLTAGDRAATMVAKRMTTRAPGAGGAGGGGGGGGGGGRDTTVGADEAEERVMVAKVRAQLAEAEKLLPPSRITIGRLLAPALAF